MMNYHDIFNTIVYNRKKILSITLLSVFLLIIILFFIYPRTYYSPVSILPPESKQNSMGLGSLLAGGDFTSLLSGGISTANSQLYMEILKSRSACEFVIHKHNLLEYLGADNLYEGCEKLSKKIKMDLNKEGIIRLSIEVNSSWFPLFSKKTDSYPVLAADLSNSFVEALDYINREKLSTKAGKAREYIEGQLVVTRENLSTAENALMNFQKQNKTVSLPDQLKAVIEGAAKIKTEMVDTEIQIGLLSTNLREDNKTLLGLREKLLNLQKQYDKIEIGNQDFLLSFKDVPELSRELAILLRDVKIQNEVYLILQQQYYKEKIQENRDLPTIEVLDAAVPPLKETSPRLLYSTVIGGIFILLLVSFIQVIAEKKHLMHKPKEYHG